MIPDPDGVLVWYNIDVLVGRCVGAIAHLSLKRRINVVTFILRFYENLSIFQNSSSRFYGDSHPKNRDSRAKLSVAVSRAVILLK
jgi:hypothetical protein